MTLLFDSQTAAYEIAFMLRGRYDGCNGILLDYYYDTIAVRTAIELAGAGFCFEGDTVPIFPDSTQTGSPTVLTDEAIAQRVAQRFGTAFQVTPF